MTVEKLQSYLLEHTASMTSDWLKNRPVSSEYSVYSLQSSEIVTEELRTQNEEFIRTVTESLTDSNANKFEQWAKDVAKSRVKSQTPIHITIANFKKFREIYWNFVTRFIEDSGEQIDPTEVSEWSVRINHAFDDMIQLYTKYYSEMTTNQLKAQQEMIMELSAPVIKLTNDIGVLPIVGEIDTYRAQLVQQKTLNKAMEMGLEYMIMDLSGVPVIDTMVAQELFQVIQSLQLLGVEAIITGIRPEIAQTAVQLGIDFGRISTYAHLQQALSEIWGLNTN
ncbi:STAS domain-containing protein [Bacillus marinisedimentorum]|uniref:STAS domain-containing protein n=1 Tax=Bacillus marinisedimentorum TaxID=1821260 RepID=UPI0007DE9518|nr:STAS domain-containing protein [Bacillus marinisedimentorum]